MRHDKQRLSLYELNSLVREVIEMEMPGAYWVEAEVSELREVGGHCYMGLIQKDIHNNTPIAKASAKCWRNTWLRIKDRFVSETGKMPQQGMKMLLQVNAQFHENYGFSWIVSDIDPTFTLGDMAAKRQQILRTLEQEGVINDNKALALPLFTQRIAVISSATAAGYGDFCNHLAENEYGYVFHTQLFEAIMQGEGVEASVIAAIDRIQDSERPFDCIVITRGGGATSDLSGFDALNLARKITYCPVPVITAIGHDRDESVLDIISHTRLKTPTAAAAFLIDRLREVEIRIDEANQRIVSVVKRKLEGESARLSHLSLRIPSLFAIVRTSQTAILDALNMRMANAARQSTLRQNHRIGQLTLKLSPAVSRIISRELHRTELLESRLAGLDPQRVLDRGFSITTYNGKAVRNPAEIPENAVIQTRLKQGVIASKVVR